MYNRSLILGLCLINLFSGYTTFAQQKKGYYIDGQMDGLVEGDKVTMRFFTEDTAIDKETGIVKSGHFHISGIVPEGGPHFYWLLVPESFGPRIIALYLDNNQNIKIRWKDNLREKPRVLEAFLNDYLLIEGSPTYRDYYDLRSAFQLYSATMNKINRTMGELKTYNRSLIEGLENSKEILDKAFLHTIALKRPINTAIPRVIRDIRNANNHSAIIAQLYDSLVSFHLDVPDSYYGKWLKEFTKLCIGREFPPFTLPDISGNQVSLKDIISKSKVTIVNFWSWNSYQSDERENELKDYYKKFKDKGLNIISVYSGTNVQKWKIASADLPWVHVSDLKGKYGIVQNLYHEVAERATTNVLIDSDGKIISWDIFGPTLQFFLDKSLGIKPGNELTSF